MSSLSLVRKKIDKPQEFICLGIESTAHTFGIGIVNAKGEILADHRSSYIPPIGGGIHPREAARHHSNIGTKLIQQGIKTAEIKPKDINLISFSQGPGMGPCLRTGAVVARSLACYLEIPLIGVNHIVSHIEIGKLLTKAEDPIILMVSGGTTQISSLVNNYYIIFGETLDISIGNCFDKFSREVGIHDPDKPWPGPLFDKIAAQGDTYYELPYSVKGMSVSYSGVLTAAVRLVKEEGKKVPNVAFSLQETALSMLTEIAERAIAHSRKKELLVVGGLARNKRFQEMLESICQDWELQFLICPYRYASDNGTMIAWGGILKYLYSGELKIAQSLVLPEWRSDQEKINWID
ncbi:MAG: tRNA (adenosine(37)-N6)-threonylcarbamoyltransferase complex transferase subunit TsaD [Candidatus Heimdallarchaeota archaeon]|nr:tRNA (adenosine(37)-N6)-threonylcarbamoyltransferase complex transferase subunit TsaD [Candidatus Heimdallarchaeota archaeon]